MLKLVCCILLLLFLLLDILLYIQFYLDIKNGK